MSGRCEMPPLCCADCRLPYGAAGWCDVVVENATWLRISPTGTEGGLLCLTCMAARLVALGLENVPTKITSGPFQVLAAADPRVLREGRWQDPAPTTQAGSVPGTSVGTFFTYRETRP